MTSDEHRCEGLLRGCGDIWNRHRARCKKTGKHEEDGKWWCGTHSPSKTKEREERATKEYLADCDRRNLMNKQRVLMEQMGKEAYDHGFRSVDSLRGFFRAGKGLLE